MCSCRYFTSHSSQGRSSTRSDDTTLMCDLGMHVQVTYIHLFSARVPHVVCRFEWDFPQFAALPWSRTNETASGPLGHQASTAAMEARPSSGRWMTSRSSVVAKVRRGRMRWRMSPSNVPVMWASILRSSCGRPSIHCVFENG